MKFKERPSPARDLRKIPATKQRRKISIAPPMVFPLIVSFAMKTKPSGAKTSPIIKKLKLMTAISFGKNQKRTNVLAKKKV